MPCGVDVILGMNGYVWVSKHIQEDQQVGEEGFDAEAVYSNVNDVRSFAFPLHLHLIQSADLPSLLILPLELLFLEYRISSPLLRGAMSRSQIYFLMKRMIGPWSKI